MLMAHKFEDCCHVNIYFTLIEEEGEQETLRDSLQNMQCIFELILDQCQINLCITSHSLPVFFVFFCSTNL